MKAAVNHRALQDNNQGIYVMVFVYIFIWGTKSRGYHINQTMCWDYWHSYTKTEGLQLYISAKYFRLHAKCTLLCK